MKVTPKMRDAYFEATGNLGADELVWNWYITDLYSGCDFLKRGSGGSTNYYELPQGATELRHLIHHKKMEHGIGEAFCALYRLNDNGEYLRNLNKAKFYIECAIEYYNKENT